MHNVTMIMRPQCLVFFLLVGFNSLAQVNVSDCDGAIQLCGSDYSSEFAPTGFGNVYEYTGVCNANLEVASTWYTFSVLDAGNLNFILTPNNPVDDYDWGLFDITNGGCAGISASGPSFEVSCNSYGTLMTDNGPTGISSSLGGLANSGGPGDLNGPPFNSDLPVNAGNTYALVVMNWTNSTDGYTISFGGSTAAIYDAIAPEPVFISGDCDNSVFSLIFSEPIVVASVQASDFLIVGPGGEYTVETVTPVSEGVTSVAFTFQTTQPVLVPGTYMLHITDLSNSVNDLCSNPSLGEIAFEIYPNVLFQSEITTACNGNGGSVEITEISGGVAPYDFTFNGIYQSDLIVNNLISAYYPIVITDSRNCSGSSQIFVPSVDITISIPEQDSIACSQPSVTVQGVEVISQQDVNLSWSYLGLNGFENTGDTILNPVFNAAGLYQLTVIEPISGCMATGLTGITASSIPPDSISPYPILFNTDCDQLVYTLKFSEGIDVSSVQTEDLLLSGPEGTIGISTIVALNEFQSLADSFAVTLNVAPAVEGLYTLVFTGTNNYITDLCGNPVTQEIFIDLLAPISASYSTIAACNGNNGVVVINTISGGEIPYAISLDGNIISDYAMDSLNAGNHVLIITDNANCSVVYDNIQVENNLLIIEVPAQEVLSCTQPSIQIVGVDIIPTQTVEYQWAYFTSNGFEIINTNSASPVFSAAGMYQVTVSNPLNGCSAQTTFEIESQEPLFDNTVPEIIEFVSEDCSYTHFLLTVSEDVLIANVNSAHFSLQSDNNVLQFLSVTPLLPNLGLASQFELILATPNTLDGDYTLIINETNQPPITDPCLNALIGDILIHIPIPISFDYTITDACNNLGGALEVTNLNGGIAPYTVLFNGIISSDSNLENAVPGEYVIEILDGELCFSVQNAIVPNHLIAVEIPQQDSLSCTDPSLAIVGLTVSPNQTVSFRWEYESGSGFTAINFSNATPTISQSGIYQVTVTNADTGCSAQTSIAIFEESKSKVDLSQLQFPNVFTPNKDSKNEDWAPFLAHDPNFDVSTICEVYELKIFNRWGNLIFDSAKSNAKRWTVRDEETGVYFYTLHFKQDCSGNAERTVQGSIQLLR